LSQEKPHDPQSQVAQPVGAQSQAVEPLESPPQKEKIYEKSTTEGPLRQGEILTGLIQLKLALDSLHSDEGPIFHPVAHPFAIVVTQDCDVIQDFIPRQQGQLSSDKIIPNVLFCEVTTAQELFSQIRGSDIKKRIKQNKDERYQFLEKVPLEDDALGEGLLELGIDFKRYFSIPTDEVYLRLKNGTRRRCRLFSPYLENFSSRFYYYQSRVALPAEHRSE
jgi:hypothetical protein